MIRATEATAIADVFGLLGDPNRVRVLFALLEAGELCVHELAESVQMSPSALSHSLRLLRTSGVVANRREGREIHYRLADSHVRLLLEVTREHLDHPADDPADLPSDHSAPRLTDETAEHPTGAPTGHATGHPSATPTGHPTEGASKTGTDARADTPADAPTGHEQDLTDHHAPTRPRRRTGATR